MSMFARLFLLLGLVSSISLGAVAVLLSYNSNALQTQLQKETGEIITSEGNQLLQERLRETHLIIVREKARRVQSFFDNIADSVRLESILIRQFLADKGTSTTAPPLFEANALTHQVEGNPSFLKTLVSVRPYSIYHLAPGVTLDQTQATMTRLRRLGGFFAYTQNNVHGCDSTYFGSAEGFIQGYPGGKTFFKPAYDPRRRPWYELAIENQEPEAMNWLVYKDRDGKTLFLTCSRAVTLSGQKQPIGVAAMDVKWPDVVYELFDVGNLDVGKAILVDTSGLVRVSAVYKSKSSRSKANPIFDTKDALAIPLVSSTPGFASVMEYIRANPNRREGVYWEGKKGEHDGTPMEKARDIYLYATLNLTDAGGNSQVKQAQNAELSNNWYYMVRVPMTTLRLSQMKSIAETLTVNPSEKIRTRTNSSRLIILAVIASTLLIALGVAYVAARATSQPLIQMAKVARGVGQGDLDQQAVETSGGEIGELGRAINSMIGGLRQRNLLHESFGRYTAPSIVEEVLKRGGVQLSGVRSKATIFFSDLVGFTSLSEQIEPELLLTLLNEYLEAMTKVILDSEGTLDKYIGDALLAFWGHPIAHEDDAVRACRAALAQREALYRLRDKWEAQGYPRLDMRIGIETGEVVIGDVGSNLKLNYTVLGDTVNLASRLESLNKTYGTRILIGEATRREAGDAIEVREIDLLAVAGKSRPVRVYELLGMAGTLTPNQIAGFAAYHDALRAYYNRRWDEADAYLDRALRELGPDKPCHVLHERIVHHRMEPPPPGWDGRSVMTHK